MKRPKVLVLMSTYNGERYLKEQVDSILAQENVDVNLLVRDDGSKDETCDLLKRYAIKYPNVEWLAAENVGFVRSFSALVKLAASHEQKYDFYAFADQDDIWMPRKLAVACKALAAGDASRPNLFTSNSMRVDAKGNELGLFHPGLAPDYRRGNVLVFGTEQGCSMVFNRKAVDIYAQNEPVLTWHDRWMYHICYFLGSATYDHQPLFYYRIHAQNALANHAVTRSLAEEPRRLVRMFRILFTEPAMTEHVEMAGEFFERFGTELSKADRRVFRHFIVCRRNIFSKLYMLFSRHFTYPFNDPNERRLLKWLIMAGRL